MITAQRRTPSSASLLFGTMSSTPTPAVSSSYRRLAGNIPGTATNVLKFRSGPPPFKKMVDLQLPPTPISDTRTAGQVLMSSVMSNSSPSRVDFKLQHSTDEDEDDEKNQSNTCNHTKIIINGGVALNYIELARL